MGGTSAFTMKLLTRWLDTEYRRHARREGELLRPVLLPMMWIMVGIGVLLWTGLLVFGRGQLQIHDLPGFAVLIVLLGCIVADCIDSACDKHLIADFSWVVYTVAAAYYGLHWELVLVAMCSRGLAGMRLFPIGVVSLINASLVACEVVAAGAVAALLHGHVAPWIAVIFVAMARLIVNNVIIISAPVTGPVIEGIIDCFQTEWRQLALLAPFLATCMFATEASPIAALAGTVSASLLSMISLKSTSDVVIAESKLDIDEKTSLYNYARFSRDLGEQVVRGDSTRTPFGVFMIDIDHFKRLNDQHGHLQGDVALLSAADALRGALVGSTNVAARFGGEEFSVIITNSTPEEIERIADQVRIACKHALDPWGTSVSIGVAHHAPLTESSEELLARADAALYAAKHGGRDQVRVARAAGEHAAAVADASFQRAAAAQHAHQPEIDDQSQAA